MSRVKRTMDKELLATDTQLGVKWALANIKTMAFYIAKEESMSNAEELTMLEKAQAEFLIWAKANDITQTNTQLETLELMSEAFVDGYLKGFVKRISEGVN